MEERTFKKVWYQSRPLGTREVTMKAMEDRGSLTVSSGKLTFHGMKATVEVSEINGRLGSLPERAFMSWNVGSGIRPPLGSFDVRVQANRGR